MTYHYKREIYYYIFIMCCVHYFVIWESSSVACVCVEHQCMYWMCVCGTLVPWAVPERRCVLTPGSLQSICLQDDRPPDNVEGEVQSLALMLLWTSLDCWTEIPLQWRSAQCYSVWQMKRTEAQSFSAFHMQKATSHCPSVFGRSVIKRRKSDYLE